MKAIDQALQALIQREPTPEEVAKFYKIKEICGFSEHDSVWSLLVAFGHYEILYSEIPKSITDQTTRLLADHKLALEATAHATDRAIRSSLVESVASTAREMAEKALEAGKALAAGEQRRRLILAIVLALAITVPFVGLVAWGAFKAGEKAGMFAQGQENAWARSLDGQAAREFSRLNNVRAMLDCAGYQSRKDDTSTYCIPYDEKSKRSYGWKIK